MKVLVMGAGAVGGWYGAKLAAAGHDVYMVARGPHLEALRAASAIRVESPEGAWSATVHAIDEPVDAGSRVGLALLAVKARDNEAAMDLLYPVVNPGGDGTTLLTLQNGIDLHERLLERFGDSVLWGVARIGASLEAPGVVRQTALGDLVVGEPRGGQSERAKLVARAFEEAGVPCPVSDDVRRDLWTKLTWNTAFNMVGALARRTVGACLSDKHLRALLREAMREALAVARAEGVALPEEMADAMLAFSETIPDVRTSMLQDVERGAQTEHDLLGGSVVRRGAVRGVDTPVTATLTRLLAAASPARATG